MANDFIIKPGDIIAIGGQRAAAIASESLLGKEVADEELLTFPVQSVTVIIISKAANNKPLKAFTRHPDFWSWRLRRRA